MISYLKSLTLKQRANGILGLTAVLYCFAFVGQFFFGYESWYQPLYWAVQSALIGSVADWFGLKILISYNINPESIAAHCVDQVCHINMMAVACMEYSKSPVGLSQSQNCQRSRINR